MMPRNLIQLLVTLYIAKTATGQNTVDSQTASCGCCPVPYCQAKPKPCSINVDCECLQMAITGAGICVDMLVSCKDLLPCRFDNKTCSMPNTVCVNNTRCNIPVCMPLGRASFLRCPPYTIGSQPIRICPNATWNQTSTVLANQQSDGGQYGDFVLSVNNTVYISDWSRNQIVKLSDTNNTSKFIIVGTTNGTYRMRSLTIDNNGNVYSCEYRADTNPEAYRIQKYTQGNDTVGVTVFGETTCGTGPNQLCSCYNLFVDQRGYLYHADFNNGRVLQITPFVSTTTVVATPPGSSNTVFVDANGTLYVSTYGAVFMYSSGNTNGNLLFSSGSGIWINGFTMDSTGNIYTHGNQYLRWVPGSGTTATVLNLPSQGTMSYRIRADNRGNLYVSDQATIRRYSIMKNTC